MGLSKFSVTKVPIPQTESTRTPQIGKSCPTEEEGGNRPSWCLGLPVGTATLEICFVPLLSANPAGINSFIRIFAWRNRESMGI